MADHATRHLRRRDGSGPVIALAFVVGLTPLLLGFDLFRSENADVNEGNALLAEEKPAEALEAYARAAARHPTSSILALNRGLAFYRMEDWPRARDELLRATAAMSPVVRGDAFYNLGNAYFQMEEYEAAAEAFKRSLLINYARKDAKWNLELALRRIEEKKKEEEEKKKDDPESKPSEPESKPGDPESKPSDPESEDGEEGSEDGPPESKPADPEKSPDEKPDEPKSDDGKPEGDEDKDEGSAEAPKPEEMPVGMDPKAVLDALKDREKAVKKGERMKALGIHPRTVEKDW